VRRAYKFRAYVTRPQEGRAVRMLRDHCDLYNAALEERREAWRMRQESVSYSIQSAQLKDIRRADPDGQLDRPGQITNIALSRVHRLRAVTVPER